MTKKLILLLFLLPLINVYAGNAASVDFDEKVKVLGIELPAIAKPVGSYKPFRVSGNIIYISQVAFSHGKIVYPGRLTSAGDIERGKLAARQTMLNILAVVKDACGSLNCISKIIRLDGYIATNQDFTQHADVMNGASDLLVEIFGEQGLHARSAVGAISLPLDSAVEISAAIELKANRNYSAP